MVDFKRLEPTLPVGAVVQVFRLDDFDFFSAEYARAYLTETYGEGVEFLAALPEGSVLEGEPPRGQWKGAAR